MNRWFDINKDGWSRIMADRGKAFAVFELFQNSADTNAKNITVTLTKVPGKPRARLVVIDDDPEGFCDLSHAYTLYNDSPKRADPGMRGWMDLGEKMVLAHCIEAKIASTTGTVFFTADGERDVSKRRRREVGTEVNCLLRLTNAEYDEIVKAVDTLAPPAGLTLTFNGKVIPSREHVAAFEAQLPTRTINDNGEMIRTKRYTQVLVYEPLEGETPTLYELGIPVVVMPEDRYHIDVQQRVLVNTDRDNVPPTYLRKIRAHVLNEVHDQLNKDEAASTWVTDAMGHPDIEGTAINAVLDKRHGEKRAVWDPNDLEANNKLVAKGYAVIHGGTYGKDVWNNIRTQGAAIPSGQLAPTHKPYSDDPNAPLVDTLDRDDWTPSMREVADFIERLAEKILDAIPEVMVVRSSNYFAAAWCQSSLGSSRLDLNLKRLGHRWFDTWQENLGDVIDLVLHEFAHHFESNHLDEQYHKALSRLGGQTAVLALENKKLFRPKARRNPVKKEATA